MKRRTKLISIFSAMVIALTAWLTLPNFIGESAAAGDPVVQIEFFVNDGDYAPNGYEYVLWYWIDGVANGRVARYKTDGDNHVLSNTFTKDGNHARIFELTLNDKAVAALKSGKRLGMVIPQINDKGTPNWNTKDIGSDRYTNITFDADNKGTAYVFRGDRTVYPTLAEALNAFNQIQAAQFANYNSELAGNYWGYTFNNVRFTLTSPMAETANLMLSLWQTVGGETTMIQEVVPLPIDDFTGYAIFDQLTEENFNFEAQYQLRATSYNRPITIDMTRLVTTAKFESLYVYEGDDLGATYSKTGTFFRVWSPFAKKVMLNLYPNGDKENTTLMGVPLEMTRGEKGTWFYDYQNYDLDGVYYTYSVHVYDVVNEVADIYGTAAGVNGDRSMVIDMEATNPDGWENDTRIQASPDPNVRVNAESPIIWEIHVRDFSIHPDSGMQNKGKFLAFTEKGTTLRGDPTVKTGLDYIVDLGVTYVHILPMYDYSSLAEDAVTEIDNPTTFNWGYDPKNYNVPEGTYSSDPTRGEVRVTELKQMIKALHDEGIGVVMDVVYNHTAASSGSFFDMTFPGYYHRQWYSAAAPYGMFSDGSGCGNETASERPMFRKFMRESILHWAEEYNIDGFRFDLMALHDVDTMNYIRGDLNELDGGSRDVNNRILLYGEPWAAADSPMDDPIKRDNLYRAPGVGGFSDVIRKAIKGEDSGWEGIVNVHPGYISGGASYAKGAIWAGVKGESYDNFNVDNPGQMINYASKHDNHALVDHIVKVYYGTNASTMSFIQRNEAVVKASKLAGGIHLMAKGIPFFQAGEEVARTKLGNQNSYNSPDHINQFDWPRVAEYKDMLEYYKGLIEIRKRFNNLTDISKSSYSNFGAISVGDSNVVAYVIANYNLATPFDRSNGWQYLIVMHNPEDAPYSWNINLADASVFSTMPVAFNKSKLYRLTKVDGTIDLNATISCGDGTTVELPAKSTTILVQK